MKRKTLVEAISKPRNARNSRNVRFLKFSFFHAPYLKLYEKRSFVIGSVVCGLIPILLCGCTGKNEPATEQKFAPATRKSELGIQNDPATATRPLDTRPRVKVTRAVSHRFTDTAFVQGTVHAKTSVSISARVPGVIDALLVEEGATVKEGDPLFQIDRVNLENAVRAAEDDVRLATAALAQAEATDEKARADLSRMERLVKKGAVTVDAAEKAQLGGKSSAAQMLGAKAQLAKAQTGLAVAKKNLADSEVRAPFTGTVTKKLKDVGDYAGPGTPIFQMVDDSSCEIRFSLDASRYSAVKVNETEIAGGKVTWKSPTVDSATRTFEVRTVVPRSDEVAPGMLRDAQIVFSSFESLAVPASAVNPMKDGKEAVFTIENGKVVRHTVHTTATADGLCAIEANDLPSDARVVTQGMLLLHEGDEVIAVEDAR
ncbi:MAG: efflux RND transporter periplasmic adaptor subunit [Kiritimatiellae bacterium]|nr:efflux RND transporter periplasmic adaptor subunit [Kiritimatiellia bacterium]